MKNHVMFGLFFLVVLGVGLLAWGFVRFNDQSSLSLGLKQGYDAGYIQGLKDGAGTGYVIRDPIYVEMQEFLASDQTDKNIYNEITYNCYNYTSDVCKNAFNFGIRCGDVWIEFQDSGHAIVCFNTTDRGLVFVEPQSDSQVTLVIGQHYWDTSSYEVPDYNDTIFRYGIIW